MKPFKQLKKELDNGKIQNFYVFTGEEREVMRKYIKRIDAKAMKILTVEILWKNLFSKGLFSTEDRTYVMHNNKEIMSMDVKDIVKAVGSHTLILVYDSIDKRTKFSKNIDSFTTIFEKFTTGQLAGIVQQRFPDISDPLAIMIAKYSNNEISRLEFELDKLQQWTEAVEFEKRIPISETEFVEQDFPNHTITARLIRNLMTFPLEDRIFEMIDAVGKNIPKRAFLLYNELLEMKESPIKIVSLLYTKFKQVFLVQSYYKMDTNALMEQTGLTYYQVNFARELAGKYSNKRLVQILKQIQSTEVKMKTGQVDIILGMDTLLIDIMN